ncbi:hypothetical protein DL765_010215 [Monosporascus sp. GIB2]|nr:hypothetical protein DL765_010215 [Monosporascus sp. GIB2]
MSSPPGAAPNGSPPGLPPVPEGPFINPLGEPLPPRAVLLVAPLTAFFVLAMICIGLRLWAKRIKKNSLRFCDHAIVVAAVFATGYIAICWLAWLVQAWSNTFVRLSILDFIAHVFSMKKFRLVVYFFEACTVAYLVGCTITFFAICRPMRYNWEIGPQALEHCGNLNLKFLLSAVFNLILDVCILVLPMPMLWTLQLDSRKKIALTFVFGLGIFVCFATAWRTYHVVKFSTPEARMNFTITIVEDALWSGLEITLGIINACLPVMSPALQRLFKAPFLRLISLTWRSSKPSKFSSTGASGTSEFSGIRPPWMRLGSTKDQIPMEDMDSTTRMAANPWDYRYPVANQSRASRKPQSQGQGLPTGQEWRVGDLGVRDD